MAEYERALFRVYDRTLDSMRNDQPYFYGERFQRLRPSNVCRAVEYGLLCFALLLVGMLFVLHGSFVGNGVCLHNELSALRDLRVLTADPLAPNATAPSKPSLLTNSDILQIRLSQGGGGSNFPEKLEKLQKAAAAHVAAHPDATVLHHMPYENWTMPNQPDFVPNYRFSRNPPLLYLSDGFVANHDLNLINITLSTTCLSSGNGLAAFAASVAGWDGVMMNQVMYSIRDSGMLENAITDEIWPWGKGTLAPEGGRGFGEWIGFRVNTLVKSGLAFFFTSTVTALIVRMLISSGVVVMFPLFICLRRIGLQTLDMQILTMSYPWLGIPVDRLRQQNKPIAPLITAHLVRVLVLYSMYEACQLAWGVWLYDKPVPAGLQLWVYGIVMIWEYYSMIYLRCIAAIYYLPKFTLVYFMLFHFYFYGYAYAFFEVALLATFTMMIHSMLFCLYHLELPASERLEVSYDNPRALFTTLPWPAWEASLPPSWTLFLPLNARHRNIYEEDENGNVVGGGGAADDGGGEEGGAADGGGGEEGEDDEMFDPDNATDGADGGEGGMEMTDMAPRVAGGAGGGGTATEDEEEEVLEVRRGGVGGADGAGGGAGGSSHRRPRRRAETGSDSGAEDDQGAGIEDVESGLLETRRRRRRQGGGSED